MSVQVSREGPLLVIRIEGALSGADVTTIAQGLGDSGQVSAPRPTVLAIVAADVGLPGEDAKRAMRSSREALRNLGEMHVVVQRGGVLARMGLLLANATRFLPGQRRRAFFYRDEAEARRALQLSRP